MNRPVMTIEPAALKRLEQFPFPGNIRELENMIERAVVMSAHDMITTEFLPLMVKESTAPGKLQPLTEAKEAFEREYLRDLLRATQGNISRAAQIAGRYRADFYKLLKKYGLHPSDRQPESSTSLE